MYLYHDTSACSIFRDRFVTRRDVVSTRQACCDGRSWRCTFWLSEIAFLDTSLESAVEHRVELGLASELNLVVGLDVFLDGLTAAMVDINQLVSQMRPSAVLGTTCEMCDCGGVELTCFHFSL